MEHTITVQTGCWGQSAAETHSDQSKNEVDFGRLARRCCWTLRFKTADASLNNCTDRSVSFFAAESPVKDWPPAYWHSMHENMWLVQRAVKRVLPTGEFQRLRLHHCGWVYSCTSPITREGDSPSGELLNSSADCAEWTLQNAGFRRIRGKTKWVPRRSKPDVYRDQAKFRCYWYCASMQNCFQSRTWNA